MNDCLSFLLNYCGINDQTNPLMDLRFTTPDFSELGPTVSESKHFSRFVAKRDTWLYGKLIGQCLKIAGISKKTIELHDLGIGSGLPTILGLKQNKSHLLPIVIHGVDLDPDAVNVATANVSEFLAPEEFDCSRFQVHTLDFINYLNTLESRQSTQRSIRVLASNPPYVPITTANPDRPLLVAIDGGETGLRHIDLILDHAKNKADLLALQWSSLSSPYRLINRLTAEFELIEARCAEVPFGRLTSLASVKDFLFELKSRNEITFQVNEKDGSLSYIVAGTILRPK